MTAPARSMPSSTAEDIGISFVFGPDIDLAQDHATPVVRRGQRMPARAVRDAGSAAPQ